MRKSERAGLSVLSVGVLALSLVVVASATPPAAEAQSCASNYNGDTGVMTYGPCTAPGVVLAPAPVMVQPGTSGVVDTGPLATCAVDYNGDTGGTTYGVCDQTNGTPLVPVGGAPAVGIAAAPMPYYLDPALIQGVPPAPYVFDPSSGYYVYVGPPPNTDPYAGDNYCFPC